MKEEKEEMKWGRKEGREEGRREAEGRARERGGGGMELSVLSPGFLFPGTNRSLPAHLLRHTSRYQVACGRQPATGRIHACRR